MIHQPTFVTEKQIQEKERKTNEMWYTIGGACCAFTIHRINSLYDKISASNNISLPFY